MSRLAVRARMILAITCGIVLTGLPATASDSTVSPTAKAVRFLKRAQNSDGGLGAAPGMSSNQLFTGWAALGLAAAGHNPRDVHRRGGRSLTAYIRRAGTPRDIGELERTILVARAAGLSPRRFGGRNLVTRLLRRQRRNGSWAGNVSSSSWGLIALRAAGVANRSAPVRRARSWLEGTQNRDGGFGLAPHATSDVDITGAAVQALAAAGRRGAPPIRKAVAYLRGCQNRDGGFGMRKGQSSNAPSTAWATQGLAAGRIGPQASIRRAIRYLRRRQRRDGRIAYSRSSAQSPVWVTAEALPALLRKPFPLSPVPRR